MGDDDEMILVTGQGINLATNKERGKEGTPCCKSVLKEILLDDDDGDGTWYQFDLEKSYFQQQVGCGTRLGDALLQISTGNGDVDDDADQNDDEARGNVLLQVSVIKIIIPSVEKMVMMISMRMVIGKNRASFDAIQCHQHQIGV